MTNYASAKFPEPRPFQTSAREKLRAGFAAGHRSQMVMSPTGSGKTILAMFLIQESLLRNKRVIFVADRRTLINQTSNVADSLGLISHGVMMAGHWRYNVGLPFQIASAQTLARRDWPDADLIIIDECFIGDTLISTPSGNARIDTLKSGDLIYNACGVAQIASTFEARRANFVIVRLSNGEKFECTPDHPIFTEMGWRPAGSLVVGQKLFCKEGLRSLWQGNDAISPVPRDSKGETRSGNALHEAAVLRKILREEIKESDALRGFNKKNESDINCNWPQAKCQGWQWDGADKDSIARSFYAGQWVDDGVCSEDVEVIEAGISASLQAGCWQPGNENLHRAGRCESSVEVKEDAGYEKGQFVACIRVESIEVVERDGGVPVYNLRISGHPSYFANGILAHNCHTQLAAWTKHIQTCRAAVIGLSATPFSDGLGKLFSNLINATTMRELTESGVLVPMRVLSCTKVNMKGAATAAGEWTDKAAQERGMEIVGDVVHEWIKHGENRKTIVFGATIAHVEGLVREFNNAGIMAAAFTADTTDTERKEILDDFKTPDSALRVLVSVEALAKGFDQKDVSCVCDVRPLRKSLSTAIQMWGRGLRASPETGKTDLLLLDFSGNVVRFAEDYEAIYHDGLDALDMGEKLDKTIRKDEDQEENDQPAKCPQCQHVPFRKRCMSCGFEIIKQNLIEHEAGEMVEFKVGKATAGDKLSVWEQAVTLCRNQGKPETAKGRASHLYKSITGVFPRNLPEFDRVQNVPVSRAVMNKAKANAIAFRAAR